MRFSSFSEVYPMSLSSLKQGDISCFLVAPCCCMERLYFSLCDVVRLSVRVRTPYLHNAAKHSGEKTSACSFSSDSVKTKKHCKHLCNCSQRTHQNSWNTSHGTTTCAMFSGTAPVQSCTWYWLAEFAPKSQGSYFTLNWKWRRPASCREFKSQVISIATHLFLEAGNNSAFVVLK